MSAGCYTKRILVHARVSPPPPLPSRDTRSVGRSQLEWIVEPFLSLPFPSSFRIHLSEKKVEEEEKVDEKNNGMKVGPECR